jgi:hypothetical protein
MQKQFWPCFGGAILLSLVLSLLSPFSVSAQSPVGVVTAIRGTAQLTGPRLPTPTTLRFKDDLFIRDIVDTQKDSVVRTLLGGKFTVTVRELTRFELREETLPGGATRSVFDLATGKIRVNISRKLLTPGSEVLIQTPNAVAAVRGTTIVVDHIPERAHVDFSVICGEALITPRGLTPFTLGCNQMVTTTGAEATGGVHVGPIKEMTPADVSRALAGLNVGPSHTAEEPHVQIGTAAETARAVTHVPLPVTATPPSPATSPVGEITKTTFPSTSQAATIATTPPPAPPSPPPPPPAPPPPPPPR